MASLEIKSHAELQALIFAVNQGSKRCDEVLANPKADVKAKAKATINNFCLDELRKRLGQTKV